MRSSFVRLLALGALLAAPGTAESQAFVPDTAGVRRAALDYLEGFYEGDSSKHVRSVRPEVFKYGFYRARAEAPYEGMQMQWPGFHAFANRVKASGRPAPATAPKEVQIFEVLDQTASVKVTAWWGIDYILMGRYDGRWMISHVLWQSPPPKS